MHSLNGQAGKGDRPRPFDRKKFSDGYDRAFSKQATALIDGDIEVYKAACKGQQDLGELGQHVDLDRAKANLDTRLQTIKEACGASTIVIALSCKTRRYWRHNIEPTYKSHRRTSGERPVLLGVLAEYLCKQYDVKFLTELEADDIVGIMATNGKYKNPVVVSTDKDLKQIPGCHLNPDKIDRGTFWVDKESADRYHMFQTLVGDVVDGYSGCPRVGPVKATKILNVAEKDMWAAVVAAFIRAGKMEQDALVQARIARILRAEDWDAEKKEPKLWTPTSGQ